MKRVLLDENVDRKLKHSFDRAYEVVTVRERGWSGRKNGDLLRGAESELDVLVTLDRNMAYQQHVPKYNLAVVLITARSSLRKDLEPAMEAVNRAVGEAQPGTLTTISA